MLAIGITPVPPISPSAFTKRLTFFLCQRIFSHVPNNRCTGLFPLLITGRPPFLPFTNSFFLQCSQRFPPPLSPVCSFSPEAVYRPQASPQRAGRNPFFPEQVSEFEAGPFVNPSVSPTDTSPPESAPFLVKFFSKTKPFIPLAHSLVCPRWRNPPNFAFVLFLSPVPLNGVCRPSLSFFPPLSRGKVEPTFPGYPFRFRPSLTSLGRRSPASVPFLHLDPVMGEGFSPFPRRPSNS